MGKLGEATPWLRTALGEAAWATTRVEGSALGTRYRRVMRHRGQKKAMVAVAHATLLAIYHLIFKRLMKKEHHVLQ